MINCGLCDLLCTIFKKYIIQEEFILSKTCDLLYFLILLDIDEYNSNQQIQDKLTTPTDLNNICDDLIIRLLANYNTFSSANTLVSVLKLIGAIGRHHDINKERLSLCGVCELVSMILSQITTTTIEDDNQVERDKKVANKEYLENDQFADAICWCIGNITYPNINNQTKLSSIPNSMLTLLHIHQSHSIVIQEGLRGLRNLCHYHTINLSSFVLENDGITFLLQLIVHYQHEHTVLQWIMYILASIIDFPPALIRLQLGQITLEMTSMLRRFVQSEDLIQWTSLVIAKMARYPQLVEEFVEYHVGEAYLTVS